MRLCSTEGVLQLATCNGTPEVSWRNSRGDCQQMQKGEGPRLGLACPQEGTACPAGCGQSEQLDGYMGMPPGGQSWGSSLEGQGGEEFGNF